ncbi:hypothetical protein OPT61_g7503 [Boeremia exigua]|uniref:Uncharacterized protein n=1 Tax=Boeremia exigua TaxID=749465 RepID=A0ACC2I220_9PLEO|nr:hypothetical protein OPT61_g7503 [Boeremia exigua]
MGSNGTGGAVTAAMLKADVGGWWLGVCRQKTTPPDLTIVLCASSPPRPESSARREALRTPWFGKRVFCLAEACRGRGAVEEVAGVLALPPQRTQINYPPATMNLELHTAGVLLEATLPLTSDHTTYLILRHNNFAATAEKNLVATDVKIGRIILEPAGAKLEAIQSLYVCPGDSQATNPSGDKYQLEPASDGHVEILFLRYGDVIRCPNAESSMVCVHRASKVQVDSSATEHVREEVSKKNDGVEEVVEDETEDEAASVHTVTEVPVTQPVTQASKSQPSATPHLPRDRSDVVQETPTTTRIEYKVVAPNEDQQVALMSREPIAIAETFSTTRANHSTDSIAKDFFPAEAVTDRNRPRGSPEVRVDGRRSRKRVTTDPPPESEVEQSTEGRSVKRVKKATPATNDRDVGQASPLDSINADPNRTTYSAKGRSRSKVVAEATPTKSAKSSQRSGTVTATAYDGAHPRVATSNSAIKDGSITVKFLRRHGGTFLQNIEDKCNVLCVRDGGLAKTMKVFQAIALGIPIVTDKWLLDSAKAEGFLDLSSYKPAVAQQEADWGFSLEKVWGAAQTPFKGHCIYFTTALKKTYTNFSEMQRVCQTVGAEVALKRPSKADNLIVLASEEDDPEAEKMIEDGETCYYKDLVTTSILRGKLDLDDGEFKIKAKHTGPSRRKGPRKTT